MTKGELRAKLARSNKTRSPEGGQRRQQGCRNARPARACAHLQPAAWGVEPKAGPAGRIVDSRCMKDRKIDAGEPGGSEPPRRLSGRRCGAHCARQCRAKCGRAPQERPHECREHRDRQCAEAAQWPMHLCEAQCTGGERIGERAEPRACSGRSLPRTPSEARRRARREARARLLRLPPHERRHRAAAVEAKEERAAPPE